MFLIRRYFVKNLPWMLPVKLGSIWPCSFRGEDGNEKLYGQTTSDDKNSHGLWPGELKNNSMSKAISRKFFLRLPNQHALSVL